MHDETFNALVVRETDSKTYSRAIETRNVGDLPPGDVLVRVHYSSLNFKDALSAIGNKGVTRAYPHTPGIDAAGVVAESASPDFSPGDQVIVTSYDLGMNISGGFGEYIRVPAGWVVPLPSPLSLRDAMCYGTAGFTAALSVHQLLGHGIGPEDGELLVSGATGGVGSISVAILAKLGFSVVAVNGIADQTEYLQKIGAHRVIDIEEASDTSSRPLLKGLYSGSVDTVGGSVLATTIRSCQPYGVVTTCGNAAAAELPLTVYPFILRGVTLVGIDSQNCPMTLRRRMWEKLSGDWSITSIHDVTEEISLGDLDQRITDMLDRKRRGRTIIRLVSE